GALSSGVRNPVDARHRYAKMPATYLYTSGIKTPPNPGRRFYSGCVGWVERSETHHLTTLRPLAKTRTQFHNIAGPIFGVNPKRHHAVERRIGPIPDPCDKSML